MHKLTAAVRRAACNHIIDYHAREQQPNLHHPGASALRGYVFWVSLIRALNALLLRAHAHRAARAHGARALPVSHQARPVVR